MKFIETRDGFSIRRDDIKALERIDDLHCYCITEIGRFESNFPYETMLSLLEIEIPKALDEGNREIKELLTQIRNNQQIFAG